MGAGAMRRPPSSFVTQQFPSRAQRRGRNAAGATPRAQRRGRNAAGAMPRAQCRGRDAAGAMPLAGTRVDG